VSQTPTAGEKKPLFFHELNEKKVISKSYGEEETDGSEGELYMKKNVWRSRLTTCQHCWTNPWF
jgi:hypothetical protein